MLIIDLKVANDEVNRLKSLLEERDVFAASLLRKVEALERRNADLAATKMRSRGPEKARVSALIGGNEMEIVKIEEESVADLNAENKQKRALDLDCQKSSGASHNEPHKEVLERAAAQFKVHSRDTSSSKLFCSEIQVLDAMPSDSKEHNNVHIGESDSRIIRRCLTKEFQDVCHDRLECTSHITSQTADGIYIAPQKRKLEALGCSIEKQFGNKQYQSGGSQSIAGKTCLIVPKRRKMEAVGYTAAKQIGIKIEKFHGDSDFKLKWESAARMFNAFTANDELCMSSVCALYRKHKALALWAIGRIVQL